MRYDHKGKYDEYKDHHHNDGGRFFKRGDIQLVLLNLLVEKPMYGYEMIKVLEEKSSGFYKPSPGSIYPTLQMLEDKGFVEMINDEQKKTYKINDEGRAYLEENKENELSKGDIFSKIKHRRCDHTKIEDDEIRRKIKKVTHLLFDAGHNSMKTPDIRKDFIFFLEKSVEELKKFVQKDL